MTRFLVITVDGELTVYDRQNGLAIEHAGPWGQREADWVATALTARPASAIHFTWVPPPVSAIAGVA